MKKIRNPIIDLFAGCGGLSLGLEQAGFTPVYVNEINNDALNTYKNNRSHLSYLKNKEFFSNDIYELTKNNNLNKLKNNLQKEFGIKSGEISLVVGGPPCQGYSGIGHRRNYSVDKKELPSNFLYKEMVKVIKFFKPKGFIFENVRGILTSKWTKKGRKGEIFKDVLKEFSTLKDYFQDYKLVQCKNYGVPQNRPRVILIGIRKDIKFKPDESKPCSGLLPKEAKDYPNPEELLGDLIDNNYTKRYVTEEYLTEPKNYFQKKLRSLTNGKFLKKGDPLTEQEYSKHSDKIVKKFELMLKNGGKIPIKYKTKKFSQRVIPKKWNGKGPNITATSLPDDYVHFSQPRSLTVREWARLQMFPDHYKFYGKRTTGGIRRAGNPRIGIFDREVPKYTQIGNAVPVELAKRIGENLLKVIQDF